MSISKRMAWSAWLIASLFYAYQYVLRVMPNIMLNDIMLQFNIDAAVFGQFSGAYYIGYCLMHLPVGIMLDRYGPRKVMSGCILLTVIGLLPIIFSDHWIYPIVGRILIGTGSSAAILGTFKIIRMVFGEQGFTKMLSLSVSIGLAGAIYGGVPVSYFCESYGYKTVVVFFALFGILFAALTYLIVPEMEPSQKSTVISDIKTVLRNPRVMMVCFLAGLMVGPMEGFADAWGSEFLKQVYGFDSHTSNYLTSMIYFGMFLAPLLSRIAEKTGSYLGTIVGAGIVMFVIFVMLVGGILNLDTIGIAFFIAGICCAYQILAIYVASTYVSENVVGLTTAVANMIIMSFGYAFHSLIGLVITSSGQANGALSYTYGITVVPIALVIGTVGFLVIFYQERVTIGKRVEVTL